MGQKSSNTQKMIISQNQIIQASLSTNKFIFDMLTKNLGTLESRNINDNKLEVTIPGTLQSLFFIAKHPIGDTTNFTGFVQIFNKEQIKIFQGQFKNGMRNGFGIEFDLLKNFTYKGYFVDGLYHGWGISGGYQGQFRNGKKEGYGVFKSKIGKKNILTYQGQWKNDRFDGIGCLNVNSQEVIKIINLKQIKNKLLSSAHLHTPTLHDIQYIGQWQKGNLSGIGKLITKNEIYQGQLQNGLYEGSGILRKNGQILEGVFERGEFIKKTQKT